MNRKVLVVASLVTGAVFFALVATLGGDRLRPGEESKEAAGSVASYEDAGGTNIRRMTAGDAKAELDAKAKAHVQAVRARSRAATANLNVALSHGSSAAKTAAEARAAELERNLVDSMSSLTQSLIDNPELIPNTIALLESEENPETMMLIAQSLAEAASRLGDQFPYKDLLRMAMKEGDPKRREAAMLVLGYVTPVTQELQQQIAEISRTAALPEVRMAAITTMGSWMTRNRTLAPAITDSLLATRTASSDPSVRGYAIQTIANMDMPLTPKAMEAMKDALQFESEPNNRSLAALAIGSSARGANQQEAIQTLQTAFQNETDRTARRHLITQIAKASRWNPDGTIGSMTSEDPLIMQDIEDFRRILANSDPNDWGAIWNQKSELDHTRGTVPGGHGGHGAD